MFQAMEIDTNQTQKQFHLQFPAVDHTQKHYSLQPDIQMGWRPKNKILGPIPFNFDAKLNDQIVDELTSFGSKYKERVIYLGHRFQSSFKMHQQLQRNYMFKYQGCLAGNYQHMAAFFRKFHSNFKSKQIRIFKGMNPTIKPQTELFFQSNFESGNLDTVIKIDEYEYDLFMRIDTNTRGHLQWFNFKVKNCGRKKVKFNIVNFTKSKTLYQRGMKPYIYSEYLKQTKELNWFQGGENVTYRRKKLNYSFLEDNYDPEFITLNCLSFSYTFQADWQEVQFAYCPPFTYTDMMDMVVKLKRQVYDRYDQDQQQAFIKHDNLCDSLGGLDIPLLTITNPNVENKKKKCILIEGRVHPGQSCSSFMVKGFLEYICGQSEEASQLRKNIVFKIVPMINPDGVVIGNYRTSLCGRDLNRTFRLKNDFLIPEVRALKDLVINLKAEFKNRFIMFLDMHGHSVKKNVFIYGPQYQIWQTNYYRTRIFPKILANQTQMFRYYSCVFRIADYKRTTARAVVLRNVPHCYTIESSTGFYYCQDEKKDMPFTTEKWIEMGRKVAKAIKEYADMLNEQNLNRQQRRQKQISFRNMKNKRIHSKKGVEKTSINKFQTRTVISTTLKTKCLDDLQQKKQEEYVSKKAKELIDLIKSDQQKFRNQGPQEGHQSDAFSEGGSDSQSGDDVPETQMKDFQDKIFGFMQEYREKFYHEKPINRRALDQPLPRKKKTMDDKPARKKTKDLELIASLRKKHQNFYKGRQSLIWTRMKDDFRQIKTRGVDQGSLQSRLFASRQEISPPDIYKYKSRKNAFESQIMRKRQTTSGICSLYDR